MTQTPFSAQNQVREALTGIQQPQPNISFNQQTSPNICPSCGNMILPNFKFCPNCGKSVESREITVGRQIYIYTMSLILPPIGLYYGIKYLFNSSTKKKIIGGVAALLTIISLIITIWISAGFFQQIQKEIGMYQNLSTGNFPTGNPIEDQLLK